MKIKFYLTLSLILGSILSVSAQAPPAFATTVDDTTAPLPGLALAAVIAVGLGVRKALKAK